MRIINSAKKNLLMFACLIASSFPISAYALPDSIPGVPNKSIEDIISDMTSWILSFGIMLCVILIIWGGITYIASVGDEERIQKSKKTIHYAIYGLAIIGLSYAMIKVVNDVLISNE